MEMKKDDKAMKMKKGEAMKMKKAPTKKALKGDQNKLNEGLKAAIKAAPGKMKKGEPMNMKKGDAMKMKKGATKPAVPSAGKALPKKMNMVKGPDGKMVPDFAVDGKGANDMKKSGAKMKKASPAKKAPESEFTADQKRKLRNLAKARNKVKPSEMKDYLAKIKQVSGGKIKSIRFNDKTFS